MNLCREGVTFSEEVFITYEEGKFREERISMQHCHPYPLLASPLKSKHPPSPEILVLLSSSYVRIYNKGELNPKLGSMEIPTFNTPCHCQ